MNDNQVLEELKTINSRLNEMVTKSDLETVKKDLQGVKQEQTRTNTTLGQITTALDSLKAGQDDIRSTMAKEASVMDLGARLTRQVKDYEERITELEKERNIPHPHKH